MTAQRYDISIAVHEYFSIFFVGRGTKCAVILVKVILVKIENGLSKLATIIINIYIYLIVKKNHVSEIENDHFDHDHFDRNSAGRGVMN